MTAKLEAFRVAMGDIEESAHLVCRWERNSPVRHLTAVAVAVVEGRTLLYAGNGSCFHSRCKR